MENEMLLTDLIPYFLIVASMSFVGALSRDMYGTISGKEEKMNLKKIFISWVTSIITMSFAVVEFGVLETNQLLCFASSFISGVFGYTIFEFFMSEKGKRLLLKIAMKKVGETTDALIEALDETDDNKTEKEDTK